MITINGKTYHGNSINISGDKAYIDNNLIDDNPKTETKILSIKVEGDLVSIISDVSVQVDGDVGGSIKCGGNVNCGDVGGDVKAGGSVNCGNVGSNVKAGGSINRR